ncbi:uncharacterized protein FPRO_13994 [Fusarium proliferatum ET1]|uniref:Uncharacterized protein n=1 Tax=Fusarium proliferatum (strain ET1) TaxID=1227346 RepID=A0A1L7VVS2_FUSPR|nr:uncharacterized protein FPRO_13994 [Fusarium proliferatum ET1]CZR44221.1 uncharacterized protein FPRO_13994 [Fusarium proliferatum ET1]
MKLSDVTLLALISVAFSAPVAEPCSEVYYPEYKPIKSWGEYGGPGKSKPHKPKPKPHKPDHPGKPDYPKPGKPDHPSKAHKPWENNHGQPGYPGPGKPDYPKPGKPDHRGKPGGPGKPDKTSTLASNSWPPFHAQKKKLTSILLDAKSYLRLAPSLGSLGHTAYDLCARMMMTMFGDIHARQSTLVSSLLTHISTREPLFSPLTLRFLP